MEPVTAKQVLRWMAEHGDLLRGYTDAQEAAGRPTRMPADDGSIRANLRYLAEALTATAPPGQAAALAGFGEGLDGWFDRQRGELEAHLVRAEGAIRLEQHLQFGTEPGKDPSLDAALERRLRILGWLRLFVHGLETHLGPSADGLAEATLDWLTLHQRELGRLVISFVGHARRSYSMEHFTPNVPVEVMDRIGQTAAVRAAVRQLAEALEVTLAPAA